MRKLLLKILKYRISAVSTIYTSPIVTEEWILFGRFTIIKTLKTV